MEGTELFHDGPGAAATVSLSVRVPARLAERGTVSMNCAHCHTVLFDSWSLESFRAQQAVNCPTCGSPSVSPRVYAAVLAVEGRAD